MRRETSWLQKMLKSKDQLTTYCRSLNIIHWTQESTVSRTKKSKELKDTISGTCTMLSFMPPKTHSTQWSTESVAPRVEETASSILSLRSMSNCQDKKSNLTHLWRKFKRPLTRLPLLFLDAVRLFTTGINKILKTIKSSLFMKWSLKTRKSSKSFCSWQVQSRVQRTRLTISFQSSINLNGSGRSQLLNQSRISQKVQKNHNSQLMKVSSKNSLKLKYTLTRLNLPL